MREVGVPGLVAAHVAPHVSVLSAGEAHVAHPTQGLLDALTIYQSKQRFAGLAVAIVGDIRHSRVARSAWHVLRTLGVSDLRIVAPRGAAAAQRRVRRRYAPQRSRRGARRVRRHHDAAHPEGAHGTGGPARGRCVLPRLGTHPGAAAAGAPRCHRDASAADEPRRRDRLRGGRRAAVGDPRPGAQRRRGAHGGAGRGAAAAAAAPDEPGTPRHHLSRAGAGALAARLRRRAVRHPPGGAQVRRARRARQLRAPHLRCQHPDAPAAVDHARAPEAPAGSRSSTRSWARACTRSRPRRPATR